MDLASKSITDQQLDTSTIKTIIQPNRNSSNLVVAMMLFVVTHTASEI